MRIHPQRRVVVVSAISGVLVFGAAGFAAAATGGSHKVQAPVIAPAAATDPAATDTVAPIVSVVDTAAVGDDNGTEVENTQGTEVQDTEGTEVENQGDDNGGDDQGDDQGDDNGGNSGKGGANSGQGGGDHGGDNGGGGGDGD